MTKSQDGKIVCTKHQWPTKDCVMCMSAAYENEQIVATLQARNAELTTELKKGLPSDCIIVPLAAWNEMATQEGRFEARIAELEAAQRWIPVGERLPEDLPQSVLVYSISGIDVMCGDYVVDDSRYKLHDSVTHWMPLPTPPEAGE